MKKTILIFAFLVCLISCKVIPRVIPDEPKPPEKSSTDEKITKIGEDIKKINNDITEINKKISGAGNPDPNQETSDRILVTHQIVQFILQNKVNSDGLKFYPSKKFFLEIYERKENNEIANKDGKIIINPAKTANEPKEEIEFPADSEGTLVPIHGQDKSRELQIFFQKQGKTLIFRRNVQQNCYVLSDVNEINKDYKIRASEPIQLCVSGEDRRKVEVQAVPADFVFNPLLDVNINNAQPYQISNVNDNDDYPYNANYSRFASRHSRSVIGISSLKPDGVIAYARKRNPALNNRDIEIIRKYFKEADDEGVNVDIAIAQMLHWTNNLKQRKANHNYGGLKDCKFPNRMKDGMTEGVRAHIQPLMAYARRIPKGGKNSIVDPRYWFVFNERSSPGITFDQVYRSWSVNPRYRQEIEDILFELYLFSGVL